MKHTPGPWSIANNNIIGPESDGEYKGAHEVIARLSDRIYCKENERLILASPRLLAALRLMVDRFMDTQGSYGAWENEALDEANAAIREATDDD